MGAYVWIVLGLAVGALALRAAFPAKPLDEEYELAPDPDGKLTFRLPDYQFRVPREQFTAAIGTPGKDNMIFLSIDRREFGGPEPSGPPRISCPPESSCTDYCAPTPDNKLVGCPDVVNGWYRVGIVPVDRGWGRREGPAWHRPENDQTGFNCGDDGHPELEFCWDPARVTPHQGVTNVHHVPYSAIRVASGMLWISTALDADGLPLFYTTCNFQSCWRSIEHAGATVRLEFAYSDLNKWQQIETRLHAFAERLIKPAADRM